jgi:hypothetical protein
MQIDKPATAAPKMRHALVSSTNLRADHTHSDFLRAAQNIRVVMRENAGRPVPQNMQYIRSLCAIGRC